MPYDSNFDTMAPQPGRHERPLDRAWHLPRVPREALVLGGTALAGLGVILGLWLSNAFAPGWPHAWCGPVEAAVHSVQASGKFSGTLAALDAEQARGAPVGQLISDENTVSQDAQAVAADKAQLAADNANSLNGAALNDLTTSIADTRAELSAIRVVQDDAGALNMACGKPRSWESGSVVVPG